MLLPSLSLSLLLIACVGAVEFGQSIAECNASIAINCWSRVQGSDFNVLQSRKRKGPSAAALLNLVAIDIFKTDSKIDHIVSKMNLPEHLTDLFVVNFQIPNYSPSNPIWGSGKTNGPGFNVVGYFSIPLEVRKQLDGESEVVSSQVELLKRFIDGDRDEFKAIGTIRNPSDASFNKIERALLKQFNGESIRTAPEHRFYKAKGYFEVDVDVHLWPYLARKGIERFLKRNIDKTILDFAVLIGTTSFPEQILEGARVNRIQLDTF